MCTACVGDGCSNFATWRRKRHVTTAHPERAHGSYDSGGFFARRPDAASGSADQALILWDGHTGAPAQDPDRQQSFSHVIASLLRKLAEENRQEYIDFVTCLA